MAEISIDVVLRVLAGVVLLLSNAYFVGIEFGMTRVRQFPREEFQSRGLKKAWEMTERLEIYLSGCQVGITISSVGLGFVAEPAVAALFDPLLVAAGLATPSPEGHTALSVGLSLALINLAHVVIGEQVPTYLGVERTKFVTKYGAPVLYGWTMLMYPVIKTADWLAKAILGVFGVEMTRSWAEEELEGAEGESLSRGQLRRRMGEVLSGTLPPERREEVINALEIGETPVEEIMVPLDDVVALSTENAFEENLELMRNHPASRFPLIGEAHADYHGGVYTADVLRELDALESGEEELVDLARDPITFHASTPVSEVIDRFQEADEELALVTESGNGPVIGLVTVTDAWEAITGQLEDPLDPEIPSA